MKQKKKIELPRSTAQQLTSIIKSCRDIMRKDKGLNGDIDRLPMLTWIMFLKFLDDVERIRYEESIVSGKKFKPTIGPPYRWRDWAGKEDGITGNELIAFTNQDEAIRPDGKKGPGLLAYLRSLQGANGGDRRDVIATVFKGTVNRMINGYLLRDVVNSVNKINFASSNDIHTLGAIYESMLKEMRDAAGDAGEFYTPRPVVRFIVQVNNPRLGETILDPAAGTGGFLVEAFEHLRKQCKKTEDYGKLQKGSIFGIEAKPLPYLLCQMNLLLHDLEYPDIDSENALRFPLREIGDRDRVDVIMTNPPFGGEEERGILSNFPEDKQTAETTLLFLQLIMRKLKRPIGGKKGGRCGIVVPNGTLFGDGVCARIKKELLEEFNLHTVVRLPNGVFAPYTDIQTNLLFFDHNGPTKEIWYYEQPLPEGRKIYTKTQPIQFEEFMPCLDWWNKREENDLAWRVPIGRIAENGYNLDIKNPHSKQDFEHLPPEQLVGDILEKEQRIAQIVAEIKQVLVGEGTMSKGFPMVPLGRVITYRKEFIQINDLENYKRCRVQLHAKGIVLRDIVLGAEIQTKKQQVCRAGEFLVAEIDAKVGGFGIVPEDLDGAIVSSHYFLFVINTDVLDRQFLNFFIRTPNFREQVTARGSTNYAAIRPADVLDYQIPLPPLSEQRHIVAYLAKLNALKGLQVQAATEVDALISSVLTKAFRGEL